MKPVFWSAPGAMAFDKPLGHKRIHPNKDNERDVLIFGDDKADRQILVELADVMGLRGIHGGPPAHLAAAEALTSILIFIGKTCRIDGAGIRIAGGLVPPAA